MEQRIVSQETNRFIYYITNELDSFYLMIPKNKTVKLMIDVRDGLTDDVVRNMALVQDKAIILPVVNANVFERIKLNQVDAFNELDTVLSKIINLSYQILTYNHLEVENSIYLMENNAIPAFMTWFIQKYQGRVILERQVLSNPISAQIPQPTSVEEVKQDDSFINKTIPNVEIPEIEKPITMDETKDLGFVSYVLLGVVVAIASLIFLYFLL